MNSEPMTTITYLPTEEDEIGLRAKEKSLYTGPSFLRSPKRKIWFQAALGAAMFLSAFAFFRSLGTIYESLGLLMIGFLIFIERTVEVFSLPFPRKRKRKISFSDVRGKAASQNIFLYSDHIEIQSVSEQMQYPWTILTDWYADETGFLLSFGQDNVRFIPSRVLDEGQSAVLRELLQQG